MPNASKENIGHTRVAYNGLAEAYDYFNKTLFGNELPTVLITVQRKKNCRGYFSRDRFNAGGVKADEIALNPTEFNDRTPKEVLSTLVHEMAHLWQYVFGEPSKGGYHNKEWAVKMHSLGLIPSHTGQEGGRETGSQMTHYIHKGGKFCVLADEFLSDNKFVLYNDIRTNEDKKKATVKAQSKTKYTCEMCGLNAWAKPCTNLICGACKEVMLDENGEAPIARAA